MILNKNELIAVIDDDEVMGGTLIFRLKLEGYRVLWWRTGQEALAALRLAKPDLVISDIMLPDMNGEEVFFRALTWLAGTPFLFITAFGKFDQAVRLTKAGAVDYITKPFDLTELLERIAGLLALHPKSTGVLGISPAMRRVEMLLRRVANIDSSLLLTGESGAGKEVAANFVHEISTRAQKPFIPVNCAAIPNELIESELFGHEKGAFTGAQTRHQGYVERARDGILFLDEIGEVPLTVQAKLLRLLQTRVFTRIGGEAPIKTSARIVCATNVDLERAVAEGRFRADLFYRVNVISVSIPPLRERRDDILPLAHQFLREFAQSFNRDMHGFTPAAEVALLGHDWLGNVRELRNWVERAVALAETSWIGVEVLFPGPATETAEVGARNQTLAEVRWRAEREHIRKVLACAGQRIEDAAKLLGVSRSTLFEKMRKLGIRSDT
jgi:DNA-binding NtrC family response regulator